MNIIGANTGLVIQAMLVAASAMVVVAPPVEGTMLIVPVVPTRTAATLSWALKAGAMPVAPGPYPGSIVVYSSRNALISSAFAHKSFLLTARFSGCVSDEGQTNDQ